MANQILRSGTSIGANVREGVRGQSKSDFISKFHIALKEAEETRYWLDLLNATDYIDDKAFKSMDDDCSKIVGTLVKILKTTKDNMPQRQCP